MAKALSVGLTVNGLNSNNPEVLVRQIRDRNKKRKEALTEFNVGMNRASIFLDRWVQTNFRTEGGNVGGWAPFALGGRRLADGTIDASAKLLQKTGRLRASFLPFATKTNAGIFSDLLYSENHHEGIGVKKRRLLPKKAEVKKDIRKVLKTSITEKLQKAKGG